MLPGFISRSGADSSGPAGHSLQAGIFQHGLIRSGDEGRCVVNRGDVYVESLRNRGVTTAIGSPTIIVQSHGYSRRAINISG